MQGVCPEIEAGLRTALRGGGWPDTALQPLPDKGLAHLHVRLAGTGALARIPKQSQVALGPEANLRHEAACFDRAGASGHTPRLLGTLPVSPQLPRGALLVEEIEGRPAALPADLPAIAAALAAIHRLPVPAASGRAPLASPRDPLHALVREIDAQAVHLPRARLAPEVRRALEDELHALGRLASEPGRPGVHLIAFDAHPGNFVLRARGDAVLVDLEKCRYSSPGLDLAHATLYTSTTWDVAAHAVLPVDEVAGFYRAWVRAAGPVVADAAQPWHVALRRAMWLWSITWCCKWRVLSGEAPLADRGGEDWSSAHSDAQLIAHVRGRVDHYLSLPAIRHVRDELVALQEVLA
jgi:thiamine kinase-like enzyme